MAAMPPPTTKPTTPAPAPSTPNGGAWTQDPTSHAWTWTRGATPDPALAKAWGTAALTDIRQDPTGVRNHGAWTPVHGGGFTWTWGADPDPATVHAYGKDKATDPDHTPTGADTKSKNTPAPPDVTPPTLTDKWGGVPPHVTGDVPGSSSSTTVDHPPAHPAFLVSPGSIRNAETVVLSLADQGIVMYNSLKNYVSMSHGQNLYTNGAGWEQIVTPQDRLLLGIGDALELVGQFAEMLNLSAQNYAKADKDSFMPGA